MPIVHFELPCILGNNQAAIIVSLSFEGHHFYINEKMSIKLGNLLVFYFPQSSEYYSEF